MPEKGDFRKTKKQTEIMRLVLGAVDEGRYLTVRELKDLLYYGSGIKKQAVLCSLRILKKHGMVKLKTNGPKSAEVMPTASAYTTFRSSPVAVR